MSTAAEIVEEIKFPTEVQLLTFYMEDVMEEESSDNIYKFCKKTQRTGNGFLHPFFVDGANKAPNLDYTHFYTI